MGAGTLMLKFNFQLTNSFSHYNWFERNLGSGSTYVVMQAVAVLTVLAGFFIMFGILDNVLSFLLAPVTGLFR